jgi:putative SOS response-associated peptidase YedK
MCGRYTLTVPARLEAAFPGFRFPKLSPRYNVAPSTPVLGARNIGGHEAEYLEWGLIPYWAGDERGAAMHINARAETVAVKPAFREPLRLRRAIVFADGYYEWAKGEGTAKQPYFIAHPDRSPFAFAALWDEWHDPRGLDRLTCAIVTTDASPDLAWIHDRMPVVLDVDACAQWLTREPMEPAHARALLAAPPRERFVATPVSTAVNRAWRDDDPTLVEPVKPPEQEKLF